MVRVLVTLGFKKYTAEVGHRYSTELNVRIVFQLGREMTTSGFLRSDWPEVAISGGDCSSKIRKPFPASGYFGSWVSFVSYHVCC